MLNSIFNLIKIVYLTGDIKNNLIYKNFLNKILLLSFFHNNYYLYHITIQIK